MKKLFLFILLAITQHVFAATDLQKSDKIKIEFSFNYHIQNPNGLSNDSYIQNTLTIEPNNQWIVLGGLQSQSSTHSPSQAPHPSANQLLLLSKIEKADTQKTSLKFLIIDQDIKSYFVLEPEMTIRYDKKGEIKIHKDNRDIQITVLAKKN